MKPSSKLWLAVALAGLCGALFGGLAVLWSLSRVSSTSEPLPVLPTPHKPRGSPAAGAPDVRGRAETSFRDFEVHDLEGVRVLQIEELAAVLDSSSLRKRVVRLTQGRVRGVDIVIRRGASGRVSLAEVLGRDRAGKGGKDEDTSELALGPFQVRNARLNVALTGRPLRFQIDRASVRITRSVGDTAPRIFLSDLEGHMVEPDPLPQPVRIVGGEGVVDLGREPLVDLRTRVCIGGGELRVRIELPARHESVNLRAEAEGFTGKAALLALGLVARFKDEKLNLVQGPVALREDDGCSRAEGREEKRRLEGDREP